MSGVEIRQRAALKRQRGGEICERGGLPLCIGLTGALMSKSVFFENKKKN